jgi:hypothetical protein
MFSRIIHNGIMRGVTGIAVDTFSHVVVFQYQYHYSQAVIGHGLWMCFVYYS